MNNSTKFKWICIRDIGTDGVCVYECKCTTIKLRELYASYVGSNIYLANAVVGGAMLNIIDIAKDKLFDVSYEKIDGKDITDAIVIWLFPNIYGSVILPKCRLMFAEFQRMGLKQDIWLNG